MTKTRTCLGNILTTGTKENNKILREENEEITRKILLLSDVASDVALTVMTESLVRGNNVYNVAYFRFWLKETTKDSR